MTYLSLTAAQGQDATGCGPFEAENLLRSSESRDPLRGFSLHFFNPIFSILDITKGHDVLLSGVPTVPLTGQEVPARESDRPSLCAAAPFPELFRLGFCRVGLPLSRLWVQYG
jgi:hypothetical protein